MRNKAWGTMLFVMVPGLTAAFAQAQTFPHDGVFDSVTVYAGRGADYNLQELPGRIITGSMAWDDTYFTAIGLGKLRGTLGQSIESLDNTALGSLSHGYETQLVKHFGLQSNVEVGAAYLLKTPDLELGRVGVNFAAGAGLSYALGNPAYEDGPEDYPEQRYRMQLLALFDLEWRIIGFDKLALITRIHHRSGVYGLIAPRHVGSNFVAAGLRYIF